MKGQALNWAHFPRDMKDAGNVQQQVQVAVQLGYLICCCLRQVKLVSSLQIDQRQR